MRNRLIFSNGTYTLTDFQLFRNCGWQASEGEITFYGDQEDGLYVNTPGETYIQKEVSLDADGSCEHIVCVDMELIEGTAPRLDLLDAGMNILYSASLDEETCFSPSFVKATNMTGVAYVRFYSLDEGEYRFYSFTVEETCSTTVVDDYPVANVLSAQDYWLFGSIVQGRNYNPGSYRYGFQGQEQDDEVKGDGNSLVFKYRIHDPRLGRFLSIDPLSANYPWNSPYSFAENKVIQFIELEGAEISQPAYAGWDGTRIEIDNTGAQAINYDIELRKIQQMGQAAEAKQAMMLERAAQSGGTMSDNSYGPMQDQFNITSHNMNNMFEFTVPGYEIMGKLGRGEEITNFDLGIEVASVIPVGKIFGRVGKVLANSEFAEAGVRELATFMKNNADETAGTVLKRLEKSVAKHERRIAEHKGFIADPKTKYGDEWDGFTDQRKANEMHHWKQDIKRHEAYRDSKKAAAEEIAENQ